MSRSFLTSVNLNKNELQNAVLHPLTTAPSTPVEGQVYYNSTDKQFYQYNGTGWVRYVQAGSIVNSDIAANAAIALSKLATDPLARANHTGTQPSSTISDLATTVKAYTLDEFADPVAPINMNGYRITGLAEPVGSTDAATKNYVDSSVAGLTWKAAVNLLSSSNTALTGSTGTLAIDGHAALGSSSTGYRILLTGQSTGSQNGIYVYTDDGATYTLARSTDADAYTELLGATVFVEEGTLYGKTSWTQSNHYLSSFSGQTWVQFSGASAATAGAGLIANGNAFDVVGTANRITVNADSVDIASTYVGQTSITTLGTITSGTWNGSTVDVAHGGTGATSLTGYVYGNGTGAFTASTAINATAITNTALSTAGIVTNTSGGLLGTVAQVPVANGGTGSATAAGARTNLSSTSFALPQKYSVTNSNISPSSGIATWTINAATHGLGAVGSLVVQLKEVSSGAVVDADIIIDEADGTITIQWVASATVTAGTYRVTAIG